MFYDPAESMRPPPFKHAPYKSLVLPRPIGWISTVNADGAPNLAPFSYFNAVSDDPPCVMFCPNGTHVEGGAKDTLENVAETGEFAFNLVGWDQREQMNRTSANLPKGEDEMGFAGLDAAPCERIRAPRVKDAAATFECRHLMTLALPVGRHGTKNNIVLGQVIGIHVRDDVIVDGRIDVRKFKPVARLGYMDYAVVDDFFTMERPG